MQCQNYVGNKIKKIIETLDGGADRGKVNMEKWESGDRMAGEQ